MGRDQHKLRFRAALCRFLAASIAIALLPVFYPRTREYLWVWIGYLVLAAVGQVLIRLSIGGEVRALVFGTVDVAVITFTVHRLGSTATPMASLYFFAGVANALVVHRGVSVVLAALGVVSYDALVWLEHARILHFAPDVPQLERLGAPGLDQAVLATVFVTTFVVAATVIVGTLIRDLERREQLLKELSQRDPLTNLFNRRHVFERIEVELARVRRGSSLAVVMLDLDGFKRVNDALGHLRGDVLLKEIAVALFKTTREVDVAGRYGGDEFVVALPDSMAEQAAVAADRFARAVRDAAKRFDAAHSVTASVGLAVATRDDTVASLLRRADENAYRAKQQGGDRVVA
jgi:diguanylate cyclase (GGDEF)-like protein